VNSRLNLLCSVSSTYPHARVGEPVLLVEGRSTVRAQSVCQMLYMDNVVHGMETSRDRQLVLNQGAQNSMLSAASSSASMSPAPSSPSSSEKSESCSAVGTVSKSSIDGWSVAAAAAV